ncbi:MAG: GMC family oxidoreductase [Myxococcaceae bacterium]|nr:GMC family oxidoreductase [Myxococcaceae bacterium]
MSTGAIVPGREHVGPLELDTDVVIVGSGAAGSVVGALLQEAGQNVVLVEEGPHVPPEVYGKFRVSEHLRHMWRDSALTLTNPVGDSPAINVMMGRCVGGSSLLTGGVCFRTPEAVLHEWVTEHGLSDLSPEQMAPAFEEVEKVSHISAVPESMRSGSTRVYDEGATKRGHPLKPNRRNTRDCVGQGRCNFGCPHGRKMSVDLTYLPRAIRSGAQVFSDCLVEKIVIRNGRAVGVTGHVLNGRDGRRGGTLTVHARRVIVAASAWHTPILLLRSGVGRESGMVGRNLTLHPSFRVMAVFDRPIHGWIGALQSAYSDAFEKNGFTLMSVFAPPGVLAATMPGVGEEHARRAREIPYMAMMGGLIHDEGGGRVRPAIGREPFVTYRMSPKDRATVTELLTVLAEDFFAAGAREVVLPVLGEAPFTADRFRSYPLDKVPARRFECGSQHPLGSARMGVRPGHSVVDPDGQTWDVKELFVVDGSIFPTSLGVNPQLTVMAMATRLGWKLRERPLPKVW